MRTLKLFTFSLMLIFLSSCGEDDALTEPSSNLETPWEKRAFIGATTINGEDILGTQQTYSTNEILAWTICDTDIPSGLLTEFSMRIYIPTHPDPDYQAGILNPKMTLNIKQEVSSDIYIPGSTEFIGKIDHIDGEGQLSGFKFDGSFNGEANRDELFVVTLNYTISYIDENSEPVFEEDRKANVLIENCQ